MTTAMTPLRASVNLDVQRRTTSKPLRSCRLINPSRDREVPIRLARRASPRHHLSVSRVHRFLVTYGRYCLPWRVSAVAVAAFCLALLLGVPVVPFAGVLIGIVVQGFARVVADRSMPGTQ